MEESVREYIVDGVLVDEPAGPTCRVTTIHLVQDVGAPDPPNFGASLEEGKILPSVRIYTVGDPHDG